YDPLSLWRNLGISGMKITCHTTHVELVSTHKELSLAYTRNWGYLRPVSIRLQLHKQALFCYYDAFLTSVEPKTYNDALTQSYWIKVMQEELNEFERLGVRELVPRPDKVMVIILKWIYKVKLDELGVVEEGEPVDAAGSGATTSAIRGMTSEAG
nr:integrase, catalytic region, zinc finger, CCHC-type, peptidase aspartic, catalytic [Tanacetum cinerariifolium]